MGAVTAPLHRGVQLSAPTTNELSSCCLTGELHIMIGSIGKSVRAEMKLGAFLLLALLACSCMERNAGAGGERKLTGPAKLAVVGGDSVDWGTVAPGMLKRTIKITNEGGDTLRINEVRASCGCTTAPLDRKVLGPGDTATIDVSMDVQNKSGRQHKSLTITSNDSARGSLVLPLIADIIREVAAIPELFPMVSTTKPGEEGSTEVTLKNTSSTPITIQPPQFETPPPMIVKFDMTAPKELAPGDSLKVIAHVKPLKQEVQSATVTIPTSSKINPKIQLTMTSHIVSATPPGVNAK